MIEIRYDSKILAQYRVFSLCCHNLLKLYEALSEVCDPQICGAETPSVNHFASEFDTELRASYCVDQYDVAIKSIDLSLQLLQNRCSRNPAGRDKLETLRQAVHADDASHWDFQPSMEEFRDIGKRLAQHFYRKGGREPSLELLSKDPDLVFNNLSASQIMGRLPPMFTVPGGDQIHILFSKDTGVLDYLSYPFMFYN